MANIDSINFYFGLKVEQNREDKTIKISQPMYIKNILCKFFLDLANLSNTLIRKSMQLLPNDRKKKAIHVKQKKYYSIIRSLMFLIVEIRPDITFATSVASRFAKNPNPIHIEAVKTILKYLKGTKNQGIV